MSLKCWLARDLDGDIYLHFSEPKEDYVSPKFWVSRKSVNVSKTAIDEAYSYVVAGSEPVCVSLSDLD